MLRSKSDNPEIAARRDLMHKIGVTGGKVEARIAKAAMDATYLLAEVEVVATYKLFNINRVRLENIIHRVFAPAQLDLTIPDRFGNPVKPQGVVFSSDFGHRRNSRKNQGRIDYEL